MVAVYNGKVFNIVEIRPESEYGASGARAARRGGAMAVSVVLAARRPSALAASWRRALEAIACRRSERR